MAIRPLIPWVVIASIAGLTGCPAPNATVAPGPMPGIQDAGTANQAVLLDVDPRRGWGVERSSEGELGLLVGSPEVRHDLASGKTTVRLSVTNAGAPLSDLSVSVSGDRQAVSQTLGESVVQKSGGTRPVELVFDNPGGDSFSVRLDFSGRQLALSAQPLARHLLSLGVVGATASSSYGTLVPERAVDGNMSSQWANGGYQEAEAHLTLDLGAVKQVTTLGLKMRPQSGGAYYRIEVSSDGSSFLPVTGQLRNSSWNTETKTLPSGTEARYVRLHFFNDASSPETRFSVFEAVVDGGAGTGSPAPTPTPAPTTSPTPTPAPSSTPAPVTGGVSASSTYSGLSPANAVDGNWSSQWSNGGYRELEAWLQWDLGSVRTLSSFTSKMRPQTGNAYYRLEVSSDGSSFSPVGGQLKNTTWGSEVQQLPSGTSGRYVRLRFFNDAGAPMDRFSVFEMQVSGGGGTATPAPTPTATPMPTPTPAPTATPTPTPSTSAGPTPPPASNPGPNAIRGRILNNGAPLAGVKLDVIKSDWSTKRTLTTDSQGLYTATGLPAGDYFMYYYNDSDRNKIGYWQSRYRRVDGSTGGVFPTVDFYGVGMQNTPRMDARVGLPTTFTWIPQAQQVQYYRYRLHSTGGRSFTLIYQSDRIPAGVNAFTWNGTGASQALSSSNRYFWGIYWDAGEVGQGGNLYQAVYFSP